MATVTIRNLPDEVHRALRIRATMHGHSTEAEIRAILDATVRPPERLRLGTALEELGRRVGLTNEDFAVLEQDHYETPAEEPIGMDRLHDVHRRSSTDMTTMRQRYIDDMCLRGLLPRTQKVFLHYFDAFCSQLECAPERTDREHLRAYLFALVDRGCARTTVLTAQNALRFFYRVTLERDWPANFLIFSIKRRRLLHDRNVTS